MTFSNGPVGYGQVNRIGETPRALFPWVPVAFGTGALIYFALLKEPAGSVVSGLAVSGMLLAACGWYAGPGLRIVLFGSALLLLGFSNAAHRAASVAAPILETRFYGPIEGRVVAIDTSRSGHRRLTLDRARLGQISPSETPARVRIALHGDWSLPDAEPGQVVMTTGHLSPPPAPAEPGGFDFRRYAWFKKLGGVGYSRNPVVLAERAQPGDPALRLYRLRLAIAAWIRDAIPGQPGAFSAAILTGDRSAIDPVRVDDLRRSNLAHLLAISGLHMALLTGVVFAGMWAVLCLSPHLALNWPVNKIAAMAALLTAIAYLFLSGGTVATQRAFVMVALVLVGVCFDRRALSLRSVAMAALVVLTLWPEGVTGPGFQMSFAATTALVVVYTGLTDKGWWQELPKWVAGPASLVLSSLVAGLATAPIAAAHFNILAHYGLLANVLSVPLMGTVVMPGALLALAGAPLGIDWIGFWIMEQGVSWILGVAGYVAALPGAVGRVVAPGQEVLPLIVAGGLVMALVAHQARWLGVAPVGLALALWSVTERPQLLVSESGLLLGLMSEQGRVLSKPRGDGFAARSWLENDGDLADQFEAAGRKGFGFGEGRVDLKLGPMTITQLRGKAGRAHLREACASADLVILANGPRGPVDCPLIEAADLRARGALALSEVNGLIIAVGAKEAAGVRKWTAPIKKRASDNQFAKAQ